MSKLWATSSVAEVQFRTDPENQNRQNRTENSVLFCSGSLSSLPCSVFGSLKFQIIRTGSEPVRTELNRPTLAIPVPPAGGWWVSGESAHSNSARPDVNKQRQALLINVVSIHHHCPSSFVMTTGKVFFMSSLFLLLTYMLTVY